MIASATASLLRSYANGIKRDSPSQYFKFSGVLFPLRQYKFSQPFV